MKIISEFGGKLQIGLQWSAPRRKNPTTSEANINACHNSLNNLPQSLHAWEGKKQCVVLCAQLTDKLQGGGQLMDLPHSSGLVTNPIFVDMPSYRTIPPNVAGTLSGLSLYIQVRVSGAHWECPFWSSGVSEKSPVRSPSWDPQSSSCNEALTHQAMEKYSPRPKSTGSTEAFGSINVKKITYFPKINVELSLK